MTQLDEFSKIFRSLLSALRKAKYEMAYAGWGKPGALATRKEAYEMAKEACASAEKFFGAQKEEASDAA